MEKTTSPTRIELAKLLIKDMKSNIKGYVKDENSLFQVTQTYLDGLTSSRNVLLKKIKKIYETNKVELDISEVLTCTDKINAIFSIDYSGTLQNINPKNVTKIIPEKHIDKECLTDKIKYYKILGDVENYEKLFISTQDFKKLKLLDFYKEFFKMIREDVETYPTVILGMDLNNSDLIDILEFILSDANKKQIIYAVTDSNVLQTRTVERLNSVGLKLLSYSVNEFYSEMKTYLGIESLGAGAEKKEYIAKKLFR